MKDLYPASRKGRALATPTLALPLGLNALLPYGRQA